MIPSCHLTSRAEAGFLRAALQAEERFGLEIAERVRADLRRAFAQLADMPRIGHRRTDLTGDPRLRFWTVGPTLIAYRERNGGIEVVLVERADLNWERLLDAVHPDQSEPG